MLVDKPAGISSFGVVGRVRYALSQREGRKLKVGHAGTLDPFATGLLILLVGKATKRAGEFLKLDKEYVATLRLGEVSTTGDPEGEIQAYQSSERLTLARAEVSTRPSGSSRRGAASLLRSARSKVPKIDKLESLLRERFTGEITQVPPVYSAIKINGQRAYRLARAGKAVEMPARQVTIYELEVLRYEWPELELRVKCSSGTYIRSLAQDIGEALEVGAYLTALRRTQIGEYRIEDARSLESVIET